MQEFEKAVNQRDNLIEHLTSSLEQALSARDAVTAQLNTLNSMQLNSPVMNDINLQQKVNNKNFIFIIINNLIILSNIVNVLNQGPGSNNYERSGNGDSSTKHGFDGHS